MRICQSQVTCLLVDDAVIQIYKNILDLLLQNTIHTSSFVLNGEKNVSTVLLFILKYYTMYKCFTMKHAA
jgi:hypothetical protein